MTLLDDVIQSFDNATKLEDVYELDESEITFENSSLNTKLNSDNIFDLMSKCPFIIQDDYAVPILFFVTQLDPDSRKTILGNLIRELGISEGFLKYGTIDILPFLHNISILKKAGYNWDTRKMRNICNEYDAKNGLVDLRFDIVEKLNNDYVVSKDIFSYIFAYCTSDRNNKGGCKFNFDYIDYESDYKGFKSDDNGEEFDEIDISKVLFVLYGMSAFSTDYKYTFRVGDPVIILGKLLEGKKKGKIIEEIEDLVSKRLPDATKFLMPLYKNYGIAPLDRITTKWHVLYSILDYQGKDSLINDGTKHRDVNSSNGNNYTDSVLLMRVGYPFVYRGRKDIIREIEFLESNPYCLRYYYSSTDNAAIIINTNTPPIKFYTGGNNYITSSVVTEALAGKKDAFSRLEVEEKNGIIDYIKRNMLYPEEKNQYSVLVQ